MKQKYFFIVVFFLSLKLFSQSATHLNFDGSNDYVQIPKTFNSDFTIEYWVKTTITAGTGGQWYSGRPIVDNEVGGVTTDFGTSLVGNKLAFGIGAPDVTIFSTTNINDGTWKHVAVSWKQTTGEMNLYINGVLESTGTGSTNQRTASNFINIGTNIYLGSFFNGNIDDVRIWNVVRTPAQISNNKNCELQGSETGLIAYYKFNQGTDSANNSGETTLTASVGPNGTLANFALTGSTSNWLAGSQVTTGSIIPGNASVSTPVVYNQGDTASALTATTGTNGTGLLWYTNATGGTGSTTAPTPSTSTAGSTSYWVTSTNANGCESGRIEIVVNVITPATHLNFDGVNDQITFANNTLLPQGVQPRTIEAWVKTTQNTSGGTILSYGNFSTNNRFSLYQTNGKLNFVAENNDYNTNFTINDGVWHHIAATYDGTNLKVYADGVQVGTTQARIFNTAGTQLTIGCISNIAFYNGNIDEVRIWNVAKTAEQIANSKNCELQGTETGLVAYYKFNQGEDQANNSTVTTLTDATANANNGTLTNFALTGATSNWLAGSPVTTGSVIPSDATVSTPVVYNQGDTASALTATTGTNGTGLMWYTMATGGTGSTTAPTPSTATAGSTSYWVASTNANGCESARMEIVVTVNVAATHLNLDGVNDYVNIPKTFTSDFTIEYWMQTTATGLSGAQWYNGSSIVDNEVAGVTTDFGKSLIGSKLAFGLGSPDMKF